MEGFSDRSRSTLLDMEIVRSLRAKNEWAKLECWLCAVWITPSPEDASSSIEEITRATATLLGQDPMAPQELKDLVTKLSKEGSSGRVYASRFRRVCDPDAESGADGSTSNL